MDVYAKSFTGWLLYFFVSVAYCSPYCDALVHYVVYVLLYGETRLPLDDAAAGRGRRRTILGRHRMTRPPDKLVGQPLPRPLP